MKKLVSHLYSYKLIYETVGHKPRNVQYHELPVSGRLDINELNYLL